ncbi:MAG TPA: UDP-N-acetylmuramoyl-L-alanine--D-glutamate ligase [Acidimicrobiales bacterium]|nr:UDP-N-acetylmuramoyl-L-alanine--D-glutamate ligase [Acidimicrobiales bacterium]
MFRPTGFADLAGRRVGIFGYGVEGRAAAARLADVAHLVLVDDHPGRGPNVLVSSEGGLDALLHCDVVLKSPGIPRRRADVVDLDLHGVAVTSALNLWLQETDRARVVALTGTKGKSTTTALTSFFLHCLGQESLRLGNIGQPPYDPSIDTSKGWLVLEVSSFQCVDLDVAPGVVVVTSLGADHLDWHGSLAQYRDDKLSLTRAEGDHHTLVPDTATFHQIESELGGDLRYVASDTGHLAAALGLIGAHNNANVALALAAVGALTGISEDDVRDAVTAQAFTFEPLRGRLTLVASEEVDGATLRYVDDGLATSVLPTVAALEVFGDEPVALIAGGYDRGVDYEELASVLAARTQPTTVITMGVAGRRLATALRQHRADLSRHAASMLEAVQLARASLDAGGVVLLSPAAPSFDAYRNWEERSDDFTKIVHSLVGGAER